MNCSATCLYLQKTAFMLYDTLANGVNVDEHVVINVAPMQLK